MAVYFRTCKFEMDSEVYIRYLIEHHDDLELPYPFAMKLSFISSPLILGNAMLIVNEEPYRIIGAAGFVYGTGAQDYEDRHICQIEVAFIEPSYRSTRLFVKGLAALIEYVDEGNPEVKVVQFWSPTPHDSLERLWGKLAALPGAEVVASASSQLSLYKIPMSAIRVYIQQFLK